MANPCGWQTFNVTLGKGIASETGRRSSPKASVSILSFRFFPFLKLVPKMARVSQGSCHTASRGMSVAFDYDSPWKEALRLYLRSFMRLCFPRVEPVIDWSREPQFLDKELQQIIRDAEGGKRFVDLLIKVWLLDGAEEWILLHIEVQHRADQGFAARLYRYNYRTYDVYGKHVATLAILADADPQWRPAHYEMAGPGSRVRFDFSVCKLLDLVADEPTLRVSREPSAVVVLANWAVQQAGKNDEQRLALKWDLTKRLYEIGLGKADILELYRLVDWLLKLPKKRGSGSNYMNSKQSRLCHTLLA
jgi:hypothetical protein